MQKKIYITLTGLPLSFTLKWPFHRATSGADSYVLHGDIRLENTDGLHAEVAVNLSLTVKEVMPSLEPAEAEAPVINALRKEVDRKQLEFHKSGKLLPVPFSSRHYDFRRNKWVFGQASDEQVSLLLLRRVCWESKLGGPGASVWIADPTDAQYLDTTPARLLEAAQGLARQGLIRLEGERATATEKLMAQAPQIEADMRHALEEVEKKHAFERG